MMWTRTPRRELYPEMILFPDLGACRPQEQAEVVLYRPLSKPHQKPQMLAPDRVDVAQSWRASFIEHASWLFEAEGDDQNRREEIGKLGRFRVTDSF